MARTLDRVTADVETLDFNTAISTLMVFVRDVEKEALISHAMVEQFVLILSPFAPHLAEELWQRLGHGRTLAHEPWPEANAALLVDEEVEVVVQVQGKLRARIRVPRDAPEDFVRERALEDANVRQHVGDRTPRRVVYVPGRLVNLVL